VDSRAIEPTPEMDGVPTDPRIAAPPAASMKTRDGR